MMTSNEPHVLWQPHAFATGDVTVITCEPAGSSPDHVTTAFSHWALGVYVSACRTITPLTFKWRSARPAKCRITLAAMKALPAWSMVMVLDMILALAARCPGQPDRPSVELADVTSGVLDFECLTLSNDLLSDP